MYTKKTVKFDRFFNMKRSTTRGSHYNHIIITWMPKRGFIITYYHLDKNVLGTAGLYVEAKLSWSSANTVKL